MCENPAMPAPDGSNSTPSASPLPQPGAGERLQSTPGVKPLRSGWKTTEFWLTLALIALATLAEFFGLVPGPWAVTASAIVGGLYVALRKLLKVVHLMAESDALTAGALPPLESLPETTSRPAPHASQRGMITNEAVFALLLVFAAMGCIALLARLCFSR